MFYFAKHEFLKQIDMVTKYYYRNISANRDMMR